MRLLVDTQALLYWVMGLGSLAPRVLALMEDRGNQLYFSTASAWEIAIKSNIGKLVLGRSIGDCLTLMTDVYDIQMLPVTPEHIAAVAELPPHPREPFDRMLVAQCMVERLALISGDTAFDAYPVARVW